MSRGSLSGSSLGRERMVRRFSVTSSPTLPSPRVAPWTNLPSRYSRAMERPSTLGSTLYSTRLSFSRTLASKSATSLSEKESCRLSSGTGWVTAAKVERA